MRGRVGFAVLLALLVAVSGRLVQIQVVDAEPYAEAASLQRLRTIPLAAVRGEITDRHGATLVQSVDGREVVADPKLVEDVEATAEAVAAVVDVPRQELEALLRKDTRFVRLAGQLPIEVGNRVEELALPGVFVRPQQVRSRPDGELAGAVVGFTGADGHGLAGLEEELDAQLAGTDGSERLEVDGSGRQIPQGTASVDEPVPGDSVTLTIDRDLQWQAEDVLARQVEATGASGGSVVILDPRTGDVLALAVAPGFDADDPSSAPAEERGNPAVSEVYEPGSVQKVVTAAAALEAGVVTSDTVFDLPSTLQIGGKTVRDDHPTVGSHTFREIVARSSNVGTVTVAERLGRERLYEAMQRFGFGEQTGIGLPGESRGLLPPPDTWSRTSDATVPIGYGVSVTALQVAQVFATVANDGVRMPPRIVLGTTSPDGTYTPAERPEPVRVVSPAVAQELTSVLEDVATEDGTAPLAAVDGYRVAGKTGTARRVDPDTGRYTSSYSSSFGGYVPADDPHLVISVVLQDSQAGIYGGTVSAPVFHDLAAYGLGRLGLPPEVGVGGVEPGAGDGSTVDGGVPTDALPDTGATAGASGDGDATAADGAGSGEATADDDGAGGEADDGGGGGDDGDAGGGGASADPAVSGR